MRRWIILALALALLALGACSKKLSKEMLDAVKPPTVEQTDPADTPQDTEQTEPDDEPTTDDTAETTAPDTDFQRRVGHGSARRGDARERGRGRRGARAAHDTRAVQGVDQPRSV